LRSGIKFLILLWNEGDDLRIGVTVGQRDAGEGDGEREAARASAAGIKVKDAVAPIDGGLVGVAADDGPDAGGGRVQIEVVDGVDEIKETAAQLYGFGGVEVVEDGGRVDIAADGGEQGDLTEAVEDARVVDIAGVEDVVDAGEFGDGFGAEEAVGVGDDANVHKAVGRV
jgi:hypothetical protein